jgi:hypothetical protein
MSGAHDVASSRTRLTSSRLHNIYSLGVVADNADTLMQQTLYRLCTSICRVDMVHTSSPAITLLFGHTCRGSRCQPG